MCGNVCLFLFCSLFIIFLTLTNRTLCLVFMGGQRFWEGGVAQKMNGRVRGGEVIFFCFCKKCNFDRR